MQYQRAMHMNWSLYLKFSMIFAVALLPVLNITVFGTSTIYYGNAGEFESGYSSLLFIFLVITVPAALLLSALGLVFRTGARQVYISQLFGLGVLLWAQGAFMMHGYGVLDDRGIDWDAFGLRAWTDLLIWGLVLVAATVFARRLSQVAVAGSLLLILAQGALFARAAIMMGEDVWTKDLKHRAFPSEEIFAYSSSGNIVHIVMDNFQSDVFLELVQEQEFEREFDGFIFFQENTAPAHHTAYSIPAIFSGRVYTGSVSPGEYYREAMESGFHNVLAEHEYKINLMPMLSMRQGRFANYFEIPGVYDGSESDVIRKEAAYLLDVSIFRQIPHIARIWMYNGNNWRLSMWLSDPELNKAFQHRKFFADYIDKLRVEDGVPAYHFMHLWPPHPPFTTTRSGRYAGAVLPNTREHYLDESRPMVKLFIDLLHRLKDLGIYDDAMILLQSDHGGGFEPEFMPRRLLGLFMVKPRGRSGPLQVSDSKTSGADAARTVLDGVSIENSFPGRDVLSIGRGENRRRRYVYFGGDDAKSLKTILIEGSVYARSSYHELPVTAVGGQTRKYRYGEFIDAGLIGEGGSYLFRGWSTQADKHVWSKGHESVLLIPADTPSGDLLLSIDVIPHIHPEMLPVQRIEVLINGRELTRWEVRERRAQRLQAEIPANWIDSPELMITFRLPDAASPRALGTGGDRRVLGMALRRFQLQELPVEP